MQSVPGTAASSVLTFQRLRIDVGGRQTWVDDGFDDKIG